MNKRKTRRGFFNKAETKLKIQSNPSQYITHIHSEPKIKHETKSSTLKKKFWKENWKFILPIVISLTGGIPGCFSVYNNYIRKAEPFFAADVEGFSWMKAGIFDDSPHQQHQTFFLGGEIINRGNKILHPQYWNLRLKYNGKTITLQPIRLPKLFYIGDDSLAIPVRMRDFDFQLIRDLSPDQSFAGGILFPFPDDAHLLLNDHDAKMILLCIDIDGKVHECPFTWNALPSLGVEIPRLQLKTINNGDVNTDLYSR